MATEAIYRPLNKDRKEIRILHVKASNAFDATLDCTLEIVSLLSDPKPKYEAISYCWSEVSGYETIRLNDALFDVPASAAKVLRQFRKLKPKFFHHVRKWTAHDRSLWIDAVCINQADVAERSSQVSMMGEVYRSCIRCLVWLGDADDNTASALHTVKTISDQYYSDCFTAGENSPLMKSNRALFDSYSRANENTNLKHLLEFLQKPWFGRLWVLQEVALAPLATCQCGSLCIEWGDARRAGMWVSHVLVTFDIRLSLWTHGSLSGMMMTRTMNDISRSSKSGSKTIELGDLMRCSAFLDVSDSRDHFYALLGLVRWELEKDKYMQWLRVDYNLPTSAVARDATRAMIVQSQSLLALSYADGQFFWPQSSSVIDADLPSWRWYPKRRIDNLSWLSINVSCTERPLDLALVRDSAHYKCILLRGFEICEVSRLYPSYDITESTPLSQPAVKTAQMLHETTRELIGGSPGGMKSMRPYLEILTQDTRELHLGGLNDEERLLWVHDFVKHLKQRSASPCDSEPPSNDIKLTERDEKNIIRLCKYRRFFLTACGKIGLGPGRMVKSDCVAALFGGRFPCILRPYAPPEDERPHLDLEVEPKCYQFVGLAYIPGVMQGEAVEEREAMREAPVIFELW